MGDTELEKTFQQGVAAIKAGDKARARELLTKVVEENQLHEQAWLWLSAAVTDKEEQILCLENVLTINPDNEIAQRGVRKLKGLPEPVPVAPAAEPAPAPVAPAPAKSESEPWRGNIKDTGYTSEATIVRPLHEGPELGVSDLANAWMWAAIFQIPGPYQDHVDYGPAGHVGISVALAIFLQMLGVGGFVGVLFSQPSARARLFRDLPEELTSGNALSIDQILPAGMTLATLLLIVFGVLVVVTLVVLFIQAIIMNRVAEWMGGKGGTFSLLQALSISMVPTALIMIPATLAPIFIPGVGQFILYGGYLYQFLQTSNAVNASHRLGIFAGMGAVIISAVVTGVLWCCLGVVLNIIFGIAAR